MGTFCCLQGLDRLAARFPIPTTPMTKPAVRARILFLRWNRAFSARLAGNGT